MTLFHLIVLAVVQGITEFLPISSSAHLILVPHVLGTVDQGQALDVSVHVGTLLAVILYFRHDVMAMLRGLVSWVVPDRPVEGAERHLAGAIVIGTIPVLVVGLAIHLCGIDDMMRSIIVIGWASIIFGVLLWLADHYCPLDKALESLNAPRALVVGLAQVLALIPGTSRSGITMTAARALGLGRVDAARFSMFLAIPTIGAAGLLGCYEIISSGSMVLGIDALFTLVLSFVTAYATIALFLRFAQHHSMVPFVLYRCALGIVLLLVGYGYIG